MTKPGRLARATYDGAPPKLTPQVAETLLGCAAEGLPKRMAARIARISRDTLTEWLKPDNPNEACRRFAADYEEALANKGAEIWPQAVEKDPWRALAVVHQIKEPPKRVESSTKHEHKFTLPPELAIAAKQLSAEDVTAYLSESNGASGEDAIDGEIDED